MKTPKFWYNNSLNLSSILLYPFCLIWAVGSRIMKLKINKSYKFNIPVICVGNIIAGGGGKTPLTLALANLLTKTNKNVHVIYKVFNTKINSNSLKVNIKNDPRVVGDEPLLSSRITSTWVCKKRIYGIQEALKNGAEMILLDDGFQDNSIYKDYSIMVINKNQGFGNRYLIPAGPLRQNIKPALNNTDCIFFYGSKKELSKILPECKVKTIFVDILAKNQEIKKYSKRKFLAFAGIAHPENFFSFLRKNNIFLKQTISFPDHYKYKEGDIKKLIKLSTLKNVDIITTEKDYVKIPEKYKKNISKISISLKFDANNFLNHLKKKINEPY